MGPVDPAEPQAVVLAYVALASQADAARFPNRTAAQQCGSCALYSGAAGAAAGPCSIFGGRGVAAAGWCSAWVKKA
ncbi:iron permease [beta proteobacterium AAP65]|nr:iron permease [beta proteobacterium AAP65]